jgi:hypothetical protein
MSAEQLRARWHSHIEIISDEAQYLATNRQRIREIQRMFYENARLGPYRYSTLHWLMQLWGADALMGVRRELDGQHGVTNLWHMLHEMRSRPALADEVPSSDLCGRSPR